MIMLSISINYGYYVLSTTLMGKLPLVNLVQRSQQLDNPSPYLRIYMHVVVSVLYHSIWRTKADIVFGGSAETNLFLSMLMMCRFSNINEHTKCFAHLLHLNRLPNVQ